MEAKKICARLRELCRQTNRLAFKRDEVLFECGLRKEAFQSFAQDDFQFLIERDKSGVEGCIVQARQAKSVARIESFIWKITPRLDMARNEEARDIDAADAATHVVRVENGLPKKLLAASHFDRRLSFRRAAGRNDADSVASKEVHFLCLVFGEQVVKQLLALRAEHGEVRMKLIPHGLVLSRSTGQPANAARMQNRIEGCEIAKLHRKTARRPPHFLRSPDDNGIRVAQFSERQFAVKIQCDEQMLTRPFHSRCFYHKRRVPQLF